MGNFTVDQAEGLRRMLGGVRPRVFSFISTQQGSEKCSMLINLCTSLTAAGSDVLLLDACAGGRGVTGRLGQPRACLLDMAQGDAALKDVVMQVPEGFSVCALSGRRPFTAPGNLLEEQLLHSFKELAGRAGIVVIDTEVLETDEFPLAAMYEGDIVIQVTPDPASITNAYAAIKRLSAHFGRRPFGVLVTGATEAEAARIFSNMAKAASRYLAVSLDFLGSIPADAHLQRAAGLGRPVTDAFPLAGASVAFRRLAQRFAFPDSWHATAQEH